MNLEQDDMAGSNKQEFQLSEFLKDVPEIIKGNFPRMQRMKRRLVMEVVFITSFVFLCAWMHYTLPYETGWIFTVVSVFSALFLITTIITFYSYWYVPSDISRADAFHKMSRRLHLTVMPMKIIKAGMAFFILALILIDTFVTRLLTVEVLIVLLSSQAALTIFSARWIAYARKARKLAADFRDDTNKN